MKSHPLTIQLTSKSILAIAGVLVAVAGLLYGGKLIYDRIQGQPKSPAAVKRELAAYLKKKSAHRDFSINLKDALATEMPSVEAEMKKLQEEIQSLQPKINDLQAEIRTNRQAITAADQELRKLKTAAGINTSARSSNTLVQVVSTNAVTGKRTTMLVTNVPFNLAAASLTNESFKVIFEKEQALNAKQTQVSALQNQLNPYATTLRNNQQKLTLLEKESQAMQAGNPELTLARRCKQQMQEAGSWELIYKALGQELWLVDRLLSSTNQDMRQSGLQLADQAHSDALKTAENPWIACRVIEGFIWPNLEVAVAQSTNGAVVDQLLNGTGNTFLRSGETNNYIRNTELLIANLPIPARADNVRFRLVQILEQVGEYESALKQLHAIQSSNNVATAAKRITAIEDKLKKAKKKN